MNEHKIPFRGKSLSSRSAGDEKMAAIIFIHGGSMSSKIWQKQFNSELSRNYHLISYDLPGHGESDNISNYKLSELAASLAAVVRYFSPTQFVAVGNSLGGNVILQIADALTNCRGIVLLDTPPVGKPPEMEKVFLPNEAIGMFFARDYEKAKLPAIMELLFHRADHAPGFVISDFERTDGLSRQALAETVEGMDYQDEIAVLNEMEIQVAIMLGIREKMQNVDYFKSLKFPCLWKDRVHLIEDAAHCAQWENPAAFNNLLLEFCRERLN